MTRQRDHRSTAAAADAAEDPEQGWLFPKEELLSHGVLVKGTAILMGTFRLLPRAGKDGNG
jgi:hypothetical protein